MQEHSRAEAARARRHSSSARRDAPAKPPPNAGVRTDSPPTPKSPARCCAADSAWERGRWLRCGQLWTGGCSASGASTVLAGRVELGDFAGRISPGGRGRGRAELSAAGSHTVTVTRRCRPGPTCPGWPSRHARSSPPWSRVSARWRPPNASGAAGRRRLGASTPWPAAK